MALGWFLDVIAEYLFRILLRGISLLRSGSWPTVEAAKLSADCQRASYGCTVAEIRYQYTFEQRKYEGVYRKPFLSLTSGQIYVEDLAKVNQFTVRVSRRYPSVSVPEAIRRWSI